MLAIQNCGTWTRVMRICNRHDTEQPSSQNQAEPHRGASSLSAFDSSTVADWFPNVSKNLKSCHRLIGIVVEIDADSCLVSNPAIQTQIKIFLFPLETSFSEDPPSKCHDQDPTKTAAAAQP